MNRPSAFVPAAATTEHPASAPLVEPLEGRRLLAFTASVSGSAATLIGSASGDQLSLTVLNGLFRHNRFTAGDAGFASNADFDTTTPGVQVLSASGTALSVNTGDGNDVVTVGRTFDPIAATVNLNLGAGAADTAYLLDDATTNHQTYWFEGARFRRSAAVVGLADIETIEFKAGVGSDAILVRASSATLLALNANSGNDTFILGNTSGSMDGINGNVAVGGGAGTDRLRLQNQAGTATGLNFAAGAIFRAAAPTVGVKDVTYGQVESVNVSARGAFVVQAVSTPTNLTGGGGRDTFDLGPNANLLGGSIDGGGGTADTLRYPSRTAAVTVNLATGAATGARGIRGIETVVGGAGNDVLTGGAGADSLFGGGGNDLITGNGGNDTLLGSAGNDTIIGSGGDDLLLGQAGHDSLIGGDGNDLMYGGHDKDTLKGNSGHDRLYGETGDDLLDGGIGHDSLAGSSGADFLAGGDGTDNADNDPLDSRSGIELFV